MGFAAVWVSNHGASHPPPGPSPARRVPPSGAPLLPPRECELLAREYEPAGPSCATGAVSRETNRRHPRPALSRPATNTGGQSSATGLKGIGPFIKMWNFLTSMSNCSLGEPLPIVANQRKVTLLKKIHNGRSRPCTEIEYKSFLVSCKNRP